MKKFEYYGSFLLVPFLFFLLFITNLVHAWINAWQETCLTVELHKADKHIYWSSIKE